MSKKVIDFNKHLKNREKSNNNGNGKFKKTSYDFAYKFLADYDNRELYINVKFNDYDINVDLNVNLSIISHLISINPLTCITPKYLEELLNLEPQFITAIYETYKTFGFIDSKTGQVRSIKDISKSYIKKRLSIGYPKNKKKFNKILTLEKEIFSNYLKDLSDFNEKLYWKAKKRY